MMIFGCASVLYATDASLHDAIEQPQSMMFGITIGVHLAILVYNLILWRGLGRVIFLQFSGIIAAYTISTLQMSGALSQILVVISPKLLWIEAIVPSVVTGLAMLFWSTYLRRVRYLPLGRGLRAVAWMLLATGLMAAYFPLLATMLLSVLQPISYTMLMYTAVAEGFRRQRTGILLAVGTLPLYVLLIDFSTFGGRITGAAQNDILPLAFIFQLFSVGIGLTESISDLRQRLVAALNSRVDAMEKLVRQRTAEVENANKTLKTEIHIRRKAEEAAINQSKQIQDAQSQLLSASRLRALGEMATGISHEINNPLTILKGYLYLIHNAMKSGEMSVEKVSELCEKAMATTDRMVSVVKGLREFSLQDEMDDPTAVNVRKSWDITVNLLREKMANAGIKYSISEFPNDLAVWVRPADFTQALLSLLNFSIESASNQEQRWIAIEVGCNDMSVMVAIRHSGPKITSEFADKLFTPFFVNMEGPETRSLGLSISKQLIASVGGDIRFVNDPSQTVFEIVLRRVYATAETESDAIRGRSA